MSGLISRIRAEYTALPGLTLTLSQASRLWSVDPRVCEMALAGLLEEGLIVKAPSGAYMKLPGARPTKKVLMTTARCPHCQKLNSVSEGNLVRCRACQRLLTVEGRCA